MILNTMFSECFNVSQQVSYYKRVYKFLLFAHTDMHNQMLVLGGPQRHF